MKKFNLKNWIRSKFIKGYGQPTKEEIIKFLNENFDLPKFDKSNEKIIYYKVNELYLLLDSHFNIVCNTETVKDAFADLRYPIVNKRQYYKKHDYKAIALVKKTTV